MKRIKGCINSKEYIHIMISLLFVVTAILSISVFFISNIDAGAINNKVEESIIAYTVDKGYIFIDQSATGGLKKSLCSR